MMVISSFMPATRYSTNDFMPVLTFIQVFISWRKMQDIFSIQKLSLKSVRYIMHYEELLFLRMRKQQCSSSYRSLAAVLFRISAIISSSVYSSSYSPSDEICFMEVAHFLEDLSFITDFFVELLAVIRFCLVFMNLLAKGGNKRVSIVTHNLRTYLNQQTQYITYMDKQQKLDYQKKVEDYLLRENVYDLFEDLTKSLIISQPDDPISFLIERLSAPEGKKIFIVGPPGFKVREFALQVADHYKFTTISVGDLLKKEVSKKLQLGEEIESYFKNYSLVKDEIVINIVKKEIDAVMKEKKSFILSGFPRTRAQGLAMQRAGIFPDAFIVLNMDKPKIEHFCEQKFKTVEKILEKDIIAKKQSHISNHATEYALNISQIKEIYKNNYFEIDCTTNNREEILEDVARLLKFKIKSKRPKRPAGIVLASGEKEQRRRIGKKLCQRYGFVFVSAQDLLKDQISKNTEVGRLALSKFREGKLIEDNIINGLVQSRLTQVDCQMQGFVLEGYPKTPGQTQALKDTYLQPTMIVMLDGGKPLSGEILKELNEKHEKVLEKLGLISQSNAFDKICFSLENS